MTSRRFLLTMLLAAVAVTATFRPRPAPAAEDQVAAGRRLYLLGCSSCHGEGGDGVRTPEGAVRGPSLRESGEAGAYYALSTGRMPLSNSEQQPQRKRRAYSDNDQAALVAYVASLGDGPHLPRLDGERERADVAEGGELFRANCAPCHAATGTGGALSYGRAAPPLHESTPLQVAAALRAGPGQMPVFGPGVLSDEQVAGIARYVDYLRDPDDRGGLPIGRTGPVPEGAVAWFFGIGAFLAAVAWIGSRSPARQADHG